MTPQELFKKYEEDLNRISELYERKLINSVELSTLKDVFYREYRRKLSEIDKGGI